jgi:hypothetical protein
MQVTATLLGFGLLMAAACVLADDDECIFVRLMRSAHSGADGAWCLRLASDL